jgi:hypothetical protein
MKDLTEVRDSTFKRVVITFAAAVIMPCILMVQGCDIPEDEDENRKDLKSDLIPVRVTELIGGNGKEYSISQYECTEDSARVSVTSEGLNLYSGIRSCRPSLNDYIMGALSAKVYQVDGRDDIVTLKVRGDEGGQLCSIGDMIISFRDDLHKQITVTGVISCNEYLIDIPIPNGDYWARVEFMGYLSEYKERQFNVSVRTIEPL